MSLRITDYTDYIAGFIPYIYIYIYLYTPYIYTLYTTLYIYIHRLIYTLLP